MSFNDKPHDSSGYLDKENFWNIFVIIKHCLLLIYFAYTIAIYVKKVNSLWVSTKWFLQIPIGIFFKIENTNSKDAEWCSFNTEIC